MKIRYLATLGALSLCLLPLYLGCDSGEPEKQPPAKLLSGKNALAPPKTTETEPDATEAERKPVKPVAMTGMTPAKVLDKMVAAYKNAKSYTDMGQVRLSMPGTNEVQPTRLLAPMSMSLEKPNKVLISANKGTAICDGKTLYEYVDPLPNQILEKPAPEKITIESIFTEPILADAMAQGPTQYYTWIPIQAVLLLSDNPLKTLLYDVERTELLKPATIENRGCYRVAAYRPDGKAVFWIDAESFVLRRFEYPLERLKRDLHTDQTKDLQVVTDFRSAELNTDIAERTFLFQPPKKTQIVETLAPLQIHMLGRPAPDFFFDMVDGKPITLKSLAGKTIVIDFWASWSMQCRNSLSVTSKIAESFKGNDKVVFLACSTDKKTVNDEELKQRLGNMKVSLPICRDTQDFSHKQFYIPGVPALVIIGPKGNIQDYQTQVFPRQQLMLQRDIEAVAAGVNLYEQQLAMFESLCTNYEIIIQRMLKEDLFIDTESISQMMPIPGVAIQSLPKRSRLTQLWNCKDVGLPGNITVLNDSDPPRILVCHDARFVAELNTRGKVVKDNRFAIPRADAAITNLRTGKTPDGKRFYVGFAPSFRQCFLLDENFQIQWEFPQSREQGAPSGIADVQIGDLSGDGIPEIYIGYLGEAGVKAVSLEGETLWSNREASGVTKITIVPPSPNNKAFLLCTTDKSSLVGLDVKGEVIKKFDLGHRRFYWITAAQLGTADATSLCGLSAPDIGKNEAFGINLNGDLLWAYQLPDGTPGSIINRITTGQLFQRPNSQWVLLGADSSIHIISESGQPIDSFNYGSFVAGIATAKLNGHPALLISSQGGVEALTVQPNE